MKTLLKQKYQDRFHDGIVAVKVYKKFYRELSYNKKGVCVHTCLIDTKSKSIVAEIGSLDNERIFYKIGVTCPSSDKTLLELDRNTKYYLSSNYVMDVFDTKPIKESFTPDNFIVKDSKGQLCKVLYIEKL